MLTRDFGKFLRRTGRISMPQGRFMTYNRDRKGLNDMNRTSQLPLDLKLEPITRAQRKKLKLQEDNEMNAYKEDSLKSKIEEFDGQGKPSDCLQCVQLSRSNQGNNMG
ncbi:hypothetical protein M9H77_23514 [Catharanthus roseus]|uniref:Uncharacterized protein n=1 Tax=Catharanthus roseus TaxID=4058 RepID=A0ACC0AU90_CATRO|nr:hypothetical protein M9H77_23514 [Catharanthus roseus]